MAEPATHDHAFEGGCDCRAIRYRMRARPLFVHCCHCRWCQRETGSAFVINALLESAQLDVTSGEPDLVDTPSASGSGQVIARCPRCRIALWSHYSGAGSKLAFVRVGTLDDPDRFPPDIHIFTSTRQPWVLLPPDVPAVAEYYKSSEMWPPESLARRKALFGP